MKKTLIFVVTFVALAFTSCKRDSDPGVPNPSQPEVSEVTNDVNETNAEDVNAEHKLTFIPETKSNFVDYGDDELGAALNAYQQNGYWFKDGVPKLIENTASRIDFFKPIEDENGKVYQFAQVSGPFDFDNDSSSPCIPYIYLYEGEANLRDAIKLFQANWRSIKFNDDIGDNMRTFFPREAGTLPNGLTVKDSYVINDMPNNIERYNGKHVFVFGGNTKTLNRDVEYIFDLQ